MRYQFFIHFRSRDVQCVHRNVGAGGCLANALWALSGDRARRNRRRNQNRPRRQWTLALRCEIAGTHAGSGTCCGARRLGQAGRALAPHTAWELLRRRGLGRRGLGLACSRSPRRLPALWRPCWPSLALQARLRGQSFVMCRRTFSARWSTFFLAICLVPKN